MLGIKIKISLFHIIAKLILSKKYNKNDITFYHNENKIQKNCNLTDLGTKNKIIATYA